MIRVILLWKLQALAQTLQNALHMGNWAATSFLKPSSLRFGVSEGFSEDWGVNFQDHCDSCIGPWELGSTLCPLHFTDDPAGNKAFKSKHTEIWQS